MRKLALKFLPGLFLALVNLGLWEVGAWNPIEYGAYNLLFQIRGPRAWAKQVVMIGIDDRSLKEYGFFPWPRRHYTNLIQQLNRANPRLIVMDVIFAESSPDDKPLAAAMLNNGKVVLPLYFDPISRLPIWPTALLEKSAVALGHIRQMTDVDGTPRAVDLSVPLESGVPIPALSLAALQAAQVLGDNTIALPAIEQGKLWLNWPRAMPNQPPYLYSAGDILQGKFDPTAFQDKIIVVGLTATGLDRLITPFDRQKPGSGVYLHAVALQNLLEKTDLINLGANFSFLLLILFVFGPVTSFLLSSQDAFQGFWRIALGICGWCGIGLLALQANVWLPVALPVGMLLMAWSSCTIIEQLKDSRLIDHKIQQLWEAYHQDLVQSGHPMGLLPRAVEADPVDQMTRLGQLAEQFGRSQSAQAAIARSLSLGLVAADPNAIVWFCNPVAQNTFGLKVGDCLADSLLTEWIPPESWKTADQQLRQTQFGSTWEVQRGVHWYILRLEPLQPWEHPLLTLPAEALPSDQGFGGYLMILEDITTLKSLEAEALTAQVQRNQALSAQNEALAIARKAAERASELKSTFLANMSHEIRTPMNAVLGMVELLQESRLDAEQIQLLDIVQHSSQTLLNVINEILDFSKLEAGVMDLECIALDLQLCIHQVLDLLAPQAHTKGLELIAWIPPTLPTMLMGDPLRLRQVLINLVGNAIKFTDSGSVSIEVQLLQDQPSEVVLNIAVIDTGIGIATEAQDKLFKSFSQVDASTTRKFGGTGLGLAICKHLVSLMRGEIGVESQAGIGTRFWITVPLRRQLDDKEERPLPALSHLQEISPALQAQPILVASAVPAVRDFFHRFAQAWGLSLTSFPSGSAVLSHLRTLIPAEPSGEEAAEAGRSEPLFLWIDWQLSDYQAPELAQQIQQIQLRSQHNSPSIWVMVNLSERERAKALMPKLFQGLTLKPLKAKSLLADLETFLRFRSGNLPASTRDSLAPETVPPAENRIIPDADSPIPLLPNPIRILVVEDNVFNQTVMLKQLQSLGYQADLADNGEVALQKLAEQPYQLVFMDCQMPVLDGFSATQALRKRELELPSADAQHTIVIALTASATKEHQERCFAAGMDDFLSKPVRKENLRAVIEHWISSAPSETPPLPSLSTPGINHRMAAIPILDIEHLNHLTEGDREFQQELLDLYLVNAQELIAHLRDALQSREWQSLLRIAHQLKGASGNAGSLRIQEFARELEDLGQAEAVAEANACIASLEKTWTELNAYLETAAFLEREG